MAEPQTVSPKDPISTAMPWANIDHDESACDPLRDKVTAPVARLSIRETHQFDPDTYLFSPEDELSESALRNTKIYSNLLLGRKVNDNEAAAFRVYVQTFAFPLYRLTRKSSVQKNQNTIEQRLYEAKRYIEGANSKEIQGEVQAPSDATVGVSRINVVQKGMHRWCPAEVQLQYFDDFMSGRPLPDVQSLVPEREVTESTKRKIAAVAIEKEPKPIDTLKALIGELLQDKNPKSELVSVMANHLVGDEVDIHSSLFMRGSIALMWTTGLAARKSRHARQNGGSLSHEVSVRDYRLIERLTTEHVTFREPWSIEDEVKDRVRQRPGCAATKEVVVQDVITVLQKVGAANRPV